MKPNVTQAGKRWASRHSAQPAAFAKHRPGHTRRHAQRRFPAYSQGAHIGVKANSTRYMAVTRITWMQNICNSCADSAHELPQKCQEILHIHCFPTVASIEIRFQMIDI